MKEMFQKLIQITFVSGVLFAGAVAGDQEHLLRGAGIAQDSRNLKEYGILGECVDPKYFPTIPFTASAYNSCTTFHELSEEKFGVCGDPDLALDGQPNNDPICAARGGDCHVAFTQRGEYLEYIFDVREDNPRAVFNIVARVSSRIPRRVQIDIDNRGETITKVFRTSGNGFFEFEDLVWERVRIPVRGPERIFVEFLDGAVNFCSLTVEQTTIVLDKTLTIPFDATAQDYLTFVELTPERYGTCGPGAVDSQPSKDAICAQRHGLCNIGWTQAGEEVTYWVENDQDDTVSKNVILRLASKKAGRRVSVEIEGQGTVQVFEVPGKGFQEYEDFVWKNASFPPGKSRVIVKFLDDRINMCSISVK